ncbi:MAG: lysine decarboxylase [Rhodobacterales bacterium 32-66-9]|nr:MAG: lysine decarboxylase [Rhodobacterales bacterium 32-66-9]
MKDEPRSHPFRDSVEDIAAAKRIPDTPQTRAPAYRLAFADRDFLTRDELRPVRLQLELLKPQLIMDERGIETTIVMFGGARIPAPEHRDTARTGGGPGVMEAGNRGADEAGGQSIGLNIVLPHEQAPNAYVTPDLSFNFHYFAIRKMHFLMRAKAVCVFPGGFGTMDEMFESLTLIQTGRMKPIPFLLFGRDWWEKVVNWQHLAEAGVISPEDLALFAMVETAEEAVAVIDGWVVP